MKNNAYYDNILMKVLTETLEGRADKIMEKITDPTPPPTEFDYVEEGETCEQCGTEMTEGECMECGYSGGEVMEKLHGKQRNLDKNKNRRIDSEDFRLLRKKGKNTEMEEGNAFSGALANAKEEGKSHFSVDGKKYPVKESKRQNDNGVLYKLEYINESALFTEEEIIDIIEGIINEENNIKKGKTPAGYVAYEKSHKGSGKEEEDYMKILAKKMTDYLKDGSKGKFETNPKHFPKGNGELAKMDKKAYEVSKDGDDFLDDYMRPGMENLDYDEIHPNEDWMKDNIEGSSKTGNNPEWANSVETNLGKKINKKRQNNKFAKARRMAANKSAQPVVSDKPGKESGKGINIKLESVNDKKTQKLNEEFDRMKNLMGYTQKTQ